MKRVIVITGASRGIGLAIALESYKRFSQDAVVVLLARDLDKLEQVKREIESNSTNQVVLLQIDFSVSRRTNELVDLLNSKLANLIDVNSIDELYVFHNHGTLHFGRVDELGDSASREFQINVVSVWEFLSAIRKLFPDNLVAKQFHVNISTMLATSVEALFSAYCTTRSARATLFKCLALEQPNLRVLNYQPGPVYTDMLKQIFDDESVQFKDSPGFKGI
jgi:sepiapterin reductase